MTHREKTQELTRFHEAADRLVQSARENPQVARQFLNEVGFSGVTASGNTTKSGSARGSRSKAASSSQTGDSKHSARSPQARKSSAR